MRREQMRVAAALGVVLTFGFGSSFVKPRLPQPTIGRLHAKFRGRTGGARTVGAFRTGGEDSSTARHSSSTSIRATSTKSGTTAFVSPVPEGFPPASTLLRPDVDGDRGHFLDVSREEYVEHKPSLWQKFKFRYQPFGRLDALVKVLKINIEGELPLMSQPEPFGTSPPTSLLGLTKALKNAAHDSRIKAVMVTVGPVQASLADIMEVRRAMDYFSQSGKPIWGFAPGIVTINELCFLGGCSKVISVPEAYVNFTGFSFGAAFYRKIFDKIGIEPQVRRIGEFKSFGDAYARDSMSAAQKEVTESLLSAVSEFKIGLLARDANRTVGELEMLYNSGPITAPMLQEFGLIDELLYKDQAEIKLLDTITPVKKNASKTVSSVPRRPKPRSMRDPSRKMLPLKRYLRRLSALRVEGVPGDRGDKTVAVIIADGAIVSSVSVPGGSGYLLVDQFRKQVQSLIANDKVSGVVIRVNSPGGDALASDLMWREVRRLREAGKVVIASVAGVAASGGYYIAMGCEKIVCDEVSITGSIGVVQAKFAFGELYDKVGYKVERISKGKYSEIFANERGFSEEEDGFWSKAAMQSYTDFVTKAAMSRRMPVEEMHRRAQGRVWTGAQAHALGLVDELGGLSKALEVCRDMVDLKDLSQEKVYQKLKKEYETKNKGNAVLRSLFSGANEAKDEATSSDSEVTVANEGDSVMNSSSSSSSSSISSAISLSNDAVPVGPLGKDESEYTEFEFQAVAEARKELEEEKANKKGRKTRVKMVAAPRQGWMKSLLGDENTLAPLDPLGFFGQRATAAAARATEVGSSLSPESAILKGLSVMVSAESMRPMAIMDDSIATLIPGIGGVPEDLRKLGVGPLVYCFMLRSPGLADAIVQLAGRLGVSSLVEN